MKRTLAIGGVAAALLLVPLATADAAPAHAAVVTAGSGQTCKQLGRHDIPRTDPAYRPALDRDGDGFACDKEESGVTPVAGPSNGEGGTSSSTDGSTSDGSTSSSDDSSSSDDASSSSDDVSSSADDSSSDDASSEGTSSEGTSDDDGDQVDVVPDGGAPTGDGSTDGSSVPYWAGGGLVALLAAAGIALRKRSSARS